MSNIVQFPKKKRPGTPPQNDEELRSTLLSNKKRLVDDIINHYGSELINKIAMHGFDMEREDFMKDYAFTIETLRSGMLRQLGIFHPMQELIDHAINDLDFDDEDGDEEDDPDRA